MSEIYSQSDILKEANVDEPRHEMGKDGNSYLLYKPIGRTPSNMTGFYWQRTNIKYWEDSDGEIRHVPDGYEFLKASPPS